jgi:hypothetical protein
MTAEIMWMGRRRQLLIQEKLQIPKWQTRADNRCMKILAMYDGATIQAVTPDLVIWKGADGWEQPEIGVEPHLEEGPDPLEFAVEDWVDQRREQKSQFKNDLVI